MKTKREPVVHKVKCWPVNFNRWICRNKSFEIRRNDRDYRSGDTLVQEEWDPSLKEYTGRVGTGHVLYVMEDQPGLQNGFCILEVPFLKMIIKQQSHEDMG